MNKPSPAKLWPDVAPDWILNLPEWLEEIFFKFYKCIIFDARYEMYFEGLRNTLVLTFLALLLGVASEELARLIGDGCDRGGKIALVIGSSYGLSEKVKKECDVRLSFSKLTFPHQLMKVVLFEALYRSFTILAGKRYHK